MMEKNKTITRQAQTPNKLFIREADGAEGPSRIIAGYSIMFDKHSAPLYEDDEEVVDEVIDREAVSQDLLDSSDIQMTLFHDSHLLLARSKNGEGTLSYRIDEKGVYFEFEAPSTIDGDKALELVRRGDLDGCSFAFTTKYYDAACVAREISSDANGKLHTTCRVKRMQGIFDFTLTANPAYPSTSVEARELFKTSTAQMEPEERQVNEEYKKQVAEMRRAASVQ